MTVKINKIQEPTVKLFGPSGDFIGIIDNNLSFLDVRLQIVQNQLDGYYIEYEGKTIHISRYGGLVEYEKGLFDQADDMLDKILFSCHDFLPQD